MVTSEHLCSKRGGVESCTGCGGWKTGRKSLSVRTCAEPPVISDRSQALSPGLCNPSTTQRETGAQRRKVYKGRGTSDIMSSGSSGGSRASTASGQQGPQPTPSAPSCTGFLRPSRKHPCSHPDFQLHVPFPSSPLSPLLLGLMTLKMGGGLPTFTRPPGPSQTPDTQGHQPLGTRGCRNLTEAEEPLTQSPVPHISQNLP